VCKSNGGATVVCDCSSSPSFANAAASALTNNLPSVDVVLTALVTSAPGFPVKSIQISATLPASFPTHAPTLFPTMVPSLVPTAKPTFNPTDYPTDLPTFDPTFEPTLLPTPRTEKPSTAKPTAAPYPCFTDASFWDHCHTGWGIVERVIRARNCNVYRNYCYRSREDYDSAVASGGCFYDSIYRSGRFGCLVVSNFEAGEMTCLGTILESSEDGYMFEDGTSCHVKTFVCQCEVTALDG
jgi:hypothetical protein